MKEIKNEKRKITAVFCDVRSVYNVGSMFRTADAAGISKLYLCGITPAPRDRFGYFRKDFAKVALGAEHAVLWESVSTRNTPALISRLQKEGWTVYAVEQNSISVPYHKVPRKFLDCKKICLVIGNEVRGLPRSILKRANAILEIPMLGKKESLNVSVAFGIVAFRMRCL